MKINQVKNNRKIIFKISEFPHVSETFIIAQIIIAIELNYKVVILVNRVLDFKQSLHEELLSKYKLDKFLVIEDVKIPNNKTLRFLKGFFLFFLNINYLSDILSFYKFQTEKSFSWIFHWFFYQQFNDSNTIFHVQYGNNKFPIDILKAKCNFKAKVITTFHGHDAFFPMHGHIPNDGYYNLLFDGAEVITANTQYLAEKIENLGCPINKIIIVPVSVNTDFFNASQKVNQNNTILKLINVGRLDPVKGHRFLIDIVHQIVEKGVDIQLTIIGDGEERKNLDQLITQYNLSDHIKLVGKKSQYEIKRMYLQADLYVFSAVPLSDGRRETQGLATLEAQACGLPVICYDSGGVKYTIEESKTGFLFDEYEIDKVVENLLYLNENRAVIQEMSNNCFKFVNDNFSEKVIARKWSKIYSNI